MRDPGDADFAGYSDEAGASGERARGRSTALRFAHDDNAARAGGNAGHGARGMAERLRLQIATSEPAGDVGHRLPACKLCGHEPVVVRGRATQKLMAGHRVFCVGRAVFAETLGELEAVWKERYGR